MKKKRILQILAMVLLLSMMLSTVAFAMPPGQAKKLLKNEYKYEKVFKHMKDKGIMFGDGFGNYGFGDFVKRSDITVMIVRAFKLNMMDVDFEEIEENFLDIIDKNSYYYNAVNTAKKFGIAKGDGKNFNPDKNVSYEEAILMIERAVKVANSNVTILNDDGKEIKLRDWYKDNFEKDKDEKNSRSKVVTFKDYLIDLLIEDEVIQKYSKTAKNDNYIDEQLRNPASRKDIASMLYYVLTGELISDEEKESNNYDIVIDLKNLEGKIEFEDLMGKKGVFEKTLTNFENEKNVDFEYVTFDSVNGGELFYDYYNKKQAVKDTTEFYIKADEDNDDKEISKITFIPDKKYNKDVYIEFTAYVESYNRKGDVEKIIPYSGLIVLSEYDKELPLIKESIKENTILDFGDLDFEDYFEDYDIDEIKFELPNEDEGILKINDKKISNKKYGIEDLEDITFVPAIDFSGKVEIMYTAYDEDDISYKGIMEITVLDVYEIKDIVIEEYDDEDIDFVDDLKTAASRSMFKAIDYVVFKLPTKGELFIKYDEDSDNKNDETFIPVVKNKKYNLDEIEGLKYKNDGNDEITIFYSAYEKISGPDKKYDGAIVITME